MSAFFLEIKIHFIHDFKQELDQYFSSYGICIEM